MDLQILRAKLYVPRYRPNAVPRSRLHERLDEGARRDLTVVSAPAGFGKTTLLADWSQRSELPVPGSRWTRGTTIRRASSCT